MAEEIPKRFRGTLSQHKFDKRVVGRVHLPKEREFLERVFERDAAGTRRLPDSLSGEERKHLKRLDHDIRKNRGSIRSMRLVALLLVVAAAVVFNLFFLDALLERGVESGLESLFRAQADVEELNFSPLAGKVTIASVTVGDRKRPMHNLFEAASFSAVVNPVELLKGNVVIHEAVVGNVVTGTARTSSAALAGPDAGADARSESGAPEGGLILKAQGAGEELFDQISGLADPEELVERELANLKSDALLDGLDAELQGFSRRWRDRVEELEQRSQDALQTASRIREIEPHGLDSPQRIADAIVLVREAASRIEQLLDEVEQSARASRDEHRELSGRVERARSLLASDFDYLASRFSRSSIDVSGFGADVARGFLMELLGDLYGSAERGVEIARRLRRSREARAEPGLARASGRDVIYPSVRYPRFFLERAGIGLTLSRLELDLSGELTGVSSDPALTGVPLRLTLSGERDGRSLSGEGELAYDAGEPEMTTVKLSGSGLSFRSDTVPRLGALRSTYDFDGTLEIAAGGDAESTLSVKMSAVELDRADSENIVVRVVQDVISGLDRVDVVARLAVEERAVRAEELSTSADEALREGISALLAEKRDSYVARAQEELRRRIERRIDELQPELSQAESLPERARQLRATLEARKELVAEKRRQLERRADELGQEQRRRVEEQAREKLEDAAEGLELDGFGF